ncbi:MULTISPECIES: helix-turn-helix domain-containing protein [unclassified Pseudomonas]|uniref:helix-turn-helix domain-containing protein n=1 Tax=Pseudomonas sp. GV105 TaxID=2135759 RepID=UPI000D3DA18D
MESYPPTLTVEQVSEITSEQPQTIRNLVSQGRYRIPSFKIGRKRVFRLIDVAQFIDQQFLADPSHPSKKKPRRGRPTKVEQMARQSGDVRASLRVVGAQL